MSASLPNGTDHASNKPLQLSFPLPHAPQTRVQLHLTILTKSILLFLTTTTADSGSNACPMGSLVYAMPNVITHPLNSFITSSDRIREQPGLELMMHETQRADPASNPPLSTPLYTQSSTLDFATRLARILARKTGKPTYVGSSVSFAGAGLGGTVEEEMEGLGRAVEIVMSAVHSVEGHVNGA